MKQLFYILFYFLIPIPGFSQLLSLKDKQDTSFPVTNTYNQQYDYYAHIVYKSGAAVHNVVAKNGVYYISGNFTHLAPNTGSSVIYDTASKRVTSSSQWQVNGLVHTCIPDGTGGFYIGGSFTKIGDSSRRYLAQIDGTGKPKPWNPVVDSFVNQVQMRNDTLFVGGMFENFNGQAKPFFAMYQLSGDSLLPNGGYGPFIFMNGIRSFLLDHDTMIYAGNASGGSPYYQPIRKYCFKVDSFHNWVVGEYGPCEDLQFNADSSVILFRSLYNTYQVKALNKLTGAILYTMQPAGPFKVVGNKVYLTGYFNVIYRNNGSFTAFRDNFATFDARNGNFLEDRLDIAGFPEYLNIIHGKMYLSGKFTSVNGVARENFAILDTGTYQVDPFQLTPTDAVSCMNFSGSKMFANGRFTGVNAVRRNGMAAIDSATGIVLPWAHTNGNFKEGKRMLISGDTLFVLGITARPSDCMINDYNSGLKIIKISTSEELPNLFNVMFNRVNEIAINDGWLYLAADGALRRASLETLSIDPGWGWDFNYWNPSQVMTAILFKGDTIITIGDNRFSSPCTGFGPKRAFVNKFLESTGAFISEYYYNESNTDYIQPVFERAALSGNHLYVQGVFNMLNGKARSNFVCINTDDGSVTDWKATFSGNADNNQYVSRMSDLKFYNNKIWFGGSAFYKLPDGSAFSGFGATDTVSGNLETPASVTLSQDLNEFPGDYLKWRNASDFIINDDELVLVGGFDFVNSLASCSIARFKLKGIPKGSKYTFTGNGNWSDPSNWMNQQIPPSILLSGSKIVIDPEGICVLDVGLTVQPGAQLILQNEKQMVIKGNLNWVK